MPAIDVTALDFQRPTRCDNSGPNCVEVARADSGVFVRDSKTPGPVLLFAHRHWDDLIGQITAGQTPAVLSWNAPGTRAELRAPGDDTVLTFTADEITAFTDSVKAGQYATAGARA
jgi:hypothetical protein